MVIVTDLPPDIKLPVPITYPSLAATHDSPQPSSSSGNIASTSLEADAEPPPAYRTDSRSEMASIRSSTRIIRLDSPTPKRKKRRRISRTCWIMIGTAIFIYVVVTTSLLILFWTGFFRPGVGFEHHDHPPAPEQATLPPFTTPDGAPPEDGYADSCNDWMRPPRPPSPTLNSNSTEGVLKPHPNFVDRLQYCLSANDSVTSAIKLFVDAAGSSSVSGSFSVVSDDALDVPMIEVQRTYRSTEAATATSVCLMRQGDRVGLGIYTPTANAEDLPTFDIVLHLPNVDMVDELVTHLPYFTQSIGVSNTIMGPQFGRLRLEGDFSPIYVRGLNVTSRRVEAITSFSAIYGNFTTSESLLLQTSQAAIDVNVTLLRDDANAPPVNLTMGTENAMVRASITVHVPDYALDQDPRPDFMILATSANAPVSIVVNHAEDSVPAQIDVTAMSEFAPVVVSMDPKFEGKFTVASGGGAEVSDAKDVRDPSGQHRQRQVALDEHDEAFVRGKVEWPGHNGRWGQLSLMTRAAKAVLYLEEECFLDSCTDGNSLPLA